MHERTPLLKAVLLGAGLCLTSATAPCAFGQAETLPADPTPPTSLPPLVEPMEPAPLIPPVPPTLPPPPTEAPPLNPPPEEPANPEPKPPEPPVEASEAVAAELAPQALSFDTLTDTLSMVGRPHPTFEIWKFRIGLSVTADLTYDDNIFLQKNNPISGTFLRIAPTISIQRAGWLSASLVYTPTFNVVLDGPLRDKLDHDLAVNLQTGTEKTSVGYQLTYQRRSGSNVEFANRVDSDYLTNRATIRYQFTEKTAGHLEGGYELRSFNGGNDSQDYYLEPYLGYKLKEKWILNLGARFGVTENTDSPKQTTQTPGFRIRYIPTEKWNFALGAGYEFRQVEGGRDFTAPHFSLSTGFRPRDGTSLSVSASRQTRVSDAYANQIIEGYYLQAQFRQRFLSRFNFVLGGGYSNEEYKNSDNNFGPSHTDSYYYIQPQIEVPLNSQQNIVLYYQRRELSSSLQTSGFENNQFGLLWSFTF